jgi:hypothetical protein
MPAAAHRRGVVRYRMKRLGDGSLVRIVVVRKAGPRGGHTIAEPVSGAITRRKVRKRRGRIHA